MNNLIKKINRKDSNTSVVFDNGYYVTMIPVHRANFGWDVLITVSQKNGKTLSSSHYNNIKNKELTYAETGKAIDEIITILRYNSEHYNLISPRKD